MPENPDDPVQLGLFNPPSASDLSVEGAIRGAIGQVHNVIVRQLDARFQDARVQVEIEREIEDAKADSVLNTLSKVVGSIKTGESITDETRESVTKLISNQEDRAELIQNLLLTHQYDRLVRYTKIRDHLERVMLTCAKRGDLTAAEALAFMKITMEQTDSISSEVRAGATSVQDLMGMLNKVDFAVQIGEKELEKKFANTSPQGREIVRRLATRLSKAANGKPPKSTVND